VTVKLNSATNSTLLFQAGDDMVFQGTANILTTGNTGHTVQIVADFENDVVYRCRRRDRDSDTVATVSVVTNILNITPRASIGTSAIPFQLTADSITTASTLGSQFLLSTQGIKLVSLVATGGNKRHQFDRQHRRHHGSDGHLRQQRVADRDRRQHFR